MQCKLVSAWLRAKETEISAALWTLLLEKDFTFCSMFGRTGAPQKGGHHKPQNVGQQRDIFWPVRASLWRGATFKSSLGAARHSLNYIRLPNSESLRPKPYLKSCNSSKPAYSCNAEFMVSETLSEGLTLSTEQRLIEFKSGGVACKE